jgi:hypothetical protein
MEPVFAQELNLPDLLLDYAATAAYYFMKMVKFGNYVLLGWIAIVLFVSIKYKLIIINLGFILGFFRTSLFYGIDSGLITCEDVFALNIIIFIFTIIVLILHPWSSIVDYFTGKANIFWHLFFYILFYSLTFLILNKSYHSINIQNLGLDDFISWNDLIQSFKPICNLKN